MLDIVIPVYNEPVNIIKTLDSIEKEIDCDRRVLIVYDSEDDTTLKPVIESAGNYSFAILRIKNAYGMGVLNAIKTGMESAAGSYVLVAMADMSDDLSAVDKMVLKMEKGNYDVVCGSRYMKGGEHHGGPVLKGCMSRIAGVSLHYLTRIPTHDVTNSFKLYSKRLLDNISIESTGGFELGQEITVKAYCRGGRVSEVPSKWYDRDEGESHFKLWTWLPHYLYWYFYCIGSTWSGKTRLNRRKAILESEKM